jgi:precorrin-6B methylase 2
VNIKDNRLITAYQLDFKNVSKRQMRPMNYIYAMISINIFIWGPWLWRYKIKPYKDRKNLWLQLNTHPDSERYKRVLCLLIMLYRKENPARISQQERKRLKIQDSAFIYGEIDFFSFRIILDKVKPQAGEIFYDLGCGAGKAVFSAVLNFDLSQAIGIELLPGLCQLANKQIKKAEAIIKTQYQEYSADYLEQLSRIQIINTDLLNCDLTQADIIYINATCFDETLWEKVQKKLLSLKIGSRIIVITKKIRHEYFELLQQSLELMSWGMNSVNIYKKIT